MRRRPGAIVAAMDPAPSPSEIAVGATLAETYEVTRLIGRGGMGAVWEARHVRLPGKRVAVKVLLGAAAGDREAYARFRRESEIASQIGHPNIVAVHDFNVLPSGTPYLVLEFLEGEDLAARLSRGRIPLDEALGLLRQIGSALAAAHRADVVHRDLKPANVYLCPTDESGVLGTRVKVLDFGISKIRGSQTVQTQDSILLGTPQYMSPEQASGKNAEIDQRTDVFALGAIAYEMLSGQPAFSGANLVAVVFRVVYEPSPSLRAVEPGLPESVVAAIDRALAKDPAARFPDVASFVSALTGQRLETLDRKTAPRRSAVTAAADPALPQTAAASLRLSAAVGEASPVSGKPASTGGSTPEWPPTRMGEAAPRRSLYPAIVVGAAVITAGALFGIARVTKERPTPPATAPRVVAPLARAPIVDASSPRDLAAPSVPDLATAPAIAPPAHRPAAPHPEQLPPEAAAELSDAQRALDRGDAQEALRLARHSLFQAKSGRAFAIITKAYCKLGDLGSAKSSLHSVGGERGAVLRNCKAVGIDLE